MKWSGSKWSPSWWSYMNKKSEKKKKKKEPTGKAKSRGNVPLG